jgi:hypothetical protein
MSVVAALMATSAAAQTAPQTIIVDGVKYQALPTTTTSAPAAVPYAYPVQAAMPAPVLVAPVAFPATPAAAPAYEAQAVHSNPNVVVPLLVTALGVWAVSQWFKQDFRERPHHPHHPHHPRPVSVYTPPPPVWLPPTHGGHHLR